VTTSRWCQRWQRHTMSWQYADPDQRFAGRGYDVQEIDYRTALEPGRAALYRLVLTEDGYTTAEDPVDRSAAMALFDRVASGCGPTSGSSLRVVSEEEYQRIWPEIHLRNEAATPTAYPKPLDDLLSLLGDDAAACQDQE
jgi:hypothetical protein